MCLSTREMGSCVTEGDKFTQGFHGKTGAAGLQGPVGKSVGAI